MVDGKVFPLCAFIFEVTLRLRDGNSGFFTLFYFLLERTWSFFVWECNYFLIRSFIILGSKIPKCLTQSHFYY